MQAPTFHLIKAIISGMPSPQHIFTGEFSPNFNLKNMILTYTKDF
jgi:hypothetical protein